MLNSHEFRYINAALSLLYEQEHSWNAGVVMGDLRGVSAG